MTQVEQTDPNWAPQTRKARHLRNFVAELLLYIGIASVFACVSLILFGIWLLIA